jgi:STAS domain
VKTVGDYLSIDLVHQDGAIRLVLVGELGSSSIPLVERVVAQAVRPYIQQIVLHQHGGVSLVLELSSPPQARRPQLTHVGPLTVDLTDVSFVDIPGLTALNAAITPIVRAGVRVRAVGTGPLALRMMSFAGLTSLEQACILGTACHPSRADASPCAPRRRRPRPLDPLR